jgi:hypothetical protein
VNGKRSLLPRPQERVHAQAEKQHHDSGCNQERAVIGPAQPAGSNPPERGRKNYHGQEKEHTHDFQPQNGSHTAKRPQKASHTARNATGGCPGNAPRSFNVLPCGAALGRPIDHRLAGNRGTVCAGRRALAGDAPRDAQADAESAANGVWFHSIYDGSSTITAPFFNICCSFLSCSNSVADVRYRNPALQPAPHTALAAAPGGYP